MNAINLNNKIKDLKSYSKNEPNKIDAYLTNIFDRSIVDVDLTRKDVSTILKTDSKSVLSPHIWYLDYKGKIIKLMFVINDNERYKRLYVSSELNVSDDVINAIGESFKK